MALERSLNARANRHPQDATANPGALSGRSTGERQGSRRARRNNTAAQRLSLSLSLAARSVAIW